MDPEAMLMFEHLPVHVSFGSQSLKRAEGAEAGLGEEVEQQVGTGVHLSLPALSWFLATQGTEQSLSGLPHFNGISKLAPKVPSLLSDKLHQAPVSPSAPPHGSAHPQSILSEDSYIPLAASALVRWKPLVRTGIPIFSVSWGP